MTHPSLDTWADLDVESVVAEIDAGVVTGGAAQEALDENAINGAGLVAFRDAHPEFYCCNYNADLIEAWFTQRGLPPYTMRNLEICVADLTERGLLAKRPEEPTVETAPRRPVTRAVQGSLATREPTPEESAFLEKVRDDHTLTDRSRKKRDELLRRAAVAQRAKFRTEPVVAI